MGFWSYSLLSCNRCKKILETEQRYLNGLLPISYIRRRITDMSEALEEMGTKGTNKAICKAAETFYNNSGLIFRALQLYAHKTEELDKQRDRKKL